eukprot:TRINITY_DN11491_c0_g1_i1.p1 TRINITY_DN11491_c0_g1~~TRINITY_DN11491_c0_g1_i1.p1  ORF type:complete len:881 (-),score=81.32 TRINITY_DN11491_c0_g1_i1:228-2870(-)
MPAQEVAEEENDVVPDLSLGAPSLSRAGGKKLLRARTLRASELMTSDECIWRLPLFQSCSEKFIDEVSGCFELKMFKPGETIVCEGDPFTTLWVLRRGDVSVRTQDAEVRVLRDGSCFGENHLLGLQYVASESFVAKTFVDMRELGQLKFIEALAHHPYERAQFQHRVVKQQIEVQQKSLLTPRRTFTGGNGQKGAVRARRPSEDSKMRRLEDQRQRLEQVIKRGRESVRMSLVLDLSGASCDFLPLTFETTPEAKRGTPDSLLSSRASTMSIKRGATTEFSLPSPSDCLSQPSPVPPSPYPPSLPPAEEDLLIDQCCLDPSPPTRQGWQTLAEWYKELSESDEGRRLNLWQVEVGRGSPTLAISAQRRATSARSPIASCTAGEGSAEPTRASGEMRQPERDALQPLRRKPVQPPFPVPPTAAGILKGSPRGLAPRAGCPRSALVRGRRPRGRQNRPGFATTQGMSGLSSTLSENTRASPRCDSRVSSEMPPESLQSSSPHGLYDAIAELMRYSRAPSRCTESPSTMAQHPDDFERSISNVSMSETGLGPPVRVDTIYEALQQHRMYGPRAVSGAGSLDSACSPATITPTLHTAPPSAPCWVRENSPENPCQGDGMDSVVPSLLKRFAPARRIEVILRGNFHSSESVDSDDDEADEIAKWHSKVNCVNTTKRETPLRPVSSRSDQGGSDFVRQRMGFSADEIGDKPSGRSSAPAFRSDTSLSPVAHLGARPRFGSAGQIELLELASIVEHHLRSLLQRSQSPAPNLESQTFASTSQTLPSVCESRKSPPSSPSRSPSPMLREEGRVNMQLHLRRARCGPSSAVLELVLDHGPDCSDANGCRCQPSPYEAEARLLAHFARHSFLRLTPTQPPTRIILELLP